MVNGFFGVVNGTLYTGGAAFAGFYIGDSLANSLTTESKEVAVYKNLPDITSRVSLIVKNILSSSVLGAALGAALGTIPAAFMAFQYGGLAFSVSSIVTCSLLGHVVGLVSGIVFMAHVFGRAEAAIGLEPPGGGSVLVEEL